MGRTCKATECITVLNSFNDGSYCHACARRRRRLPDNFARYVLMKDGPQTPMVDFAWVSVPEHLLKLIVEFAEQGSPAHDRR
jgi:hypothetical protein